MPLNNYRTGFTYPTEIHRNLSVTSRSTSNFSQHIGFPGVFFEYDEEAPCLSKRLKPENESNTDPSAEKSLS